MSIIGNQGSLRTVRADNVVLKLASASSDTVNGIATITVPIPSPGRLLQGGRIWFENARVIGDIVSICISDEDNLLGLGSGYVVSSFMDTDQKSALQGIRIPKSGEILAETFSQLGSLPGGMYLKITGTKGDLSQDTLSVNIAWGANG